MDTTNQTTADVKAPKYDTQKLKEELHALEKQISADLKTCVCVNAQGDKGASSIWFYLHAADECSSGGTLDEAVEKMAAKLRSPLTLAAEKRAQAEQLLAAAAKIEAEAAA